MVNNCFYKNHLLIAILPMALTTTLISQISSVIPSTSPNNEITFTVAVSDKSHQPVHGLKAGDFNILIEGKPITSTKVIEVPQVTQNNNAAQNLNADRTCATAADPVKTGTIFCNTDTMKYGHEQTMIIAIDERLTRSYATEAKKQIIKSLEKIPNGIYGFILLSYNDSSLSVIHNLTEDPAEIIAGVESLSSEDFKGDGKAITNAITTPKSYEATHLAFDRVLSPKMTTPDNQNSANDSGLPGATISQIAQSCLDIPGHKSLMLFTYNLPYYYHVKGRNLPFKFHPSFLYMMDRLYTADLSLHLLNASGGMSVSLGGRSPAFDTSTVWTPSSADGPMIQRNPPTPISSTVRMSSGYLPILKEFAEQTAGTAYSDNSDFANAVSDVTQDKAARYKVTLPVDGQKVKSGWNDLNIILHRANLNLQTVSGIYWNGESNPASVLDYDLRLALNSPLAFTGVKLQATVTEIKDMGNGERSITFRLSTQPGQVTVDRTDGNHLNLTIAYTIYDSSGGSPIRKDQPFDIKLQPEQAEKAIKDGINVNRTTQVAPGKYTVIFAVRDNLNGNIGSVIVPMKVE